MKRLVFCFDGTWNRIDGEYPTNVAKLAQMVAHRDGDTPQLIFYDEGVGTQEAGRWTGGMLGHGLFDNVLAAYHQLVLNHAVGDEIHVFGFSRGAFTARSFVGLIRNCGIVSRRSLPRIGEAIARYRDREDGAMPGAEAMRAFRYQHRPELLLPGDRDWRARRFPDDDRAAHDLTIRYLGVWDTVGALGIPAQLAPGELWRRRYQFHDCALSGMVEAARHAVASDERRRTFAASLWDNLDLLNDGKPGRPYRQEVFPGTHGSVGGGGVVTGLSDAALEWVMDGARAQGLRFDIDAASPIHQLRPDHRAPLVNNDPSWLERLGEGVAGLGFADRDFAALDITDVHDSLLRRYREDATRLPEREPYRPQALAELWEAIDAAGANLAEIGRKSADEAPPGILQQVLVHRVVAGDTLTKLAERHLGSARYAGVLFRHNHMLGHLHDPDRLYVGQELEIPIYRAATAP